MQTVSNIGRWWIYMVLILSLVACCDSKNPTSSAVNHVVLVWLKADTTTEEIETIISETQKLEKIGTIQSLSVGTAIPSERKIVDDSFDLGIQMRFATQQDMQTYLVDPQHVKFIDTFIKPKLQKILVYDF